MDHNGKNWMIEREGNQKLLLPKGQGYVFMCVCDSVHREGGLPHCMLGYTDPPTPPGPEAGTHTPRANTPPPGPEAGTPPPTPRTRHPPPCSACWEIQATSGRYSTYWNAILYYFCIYTGSR